MKDNFDNIWNEIDEIKSQKPSPNFLNRLQKNAVALANKKLNFSKKTILLITLILMSLLILSTIAIQTNKKNNQSIDSQNEFTPLIDISYE